MIKTKSYLVLALIVFLTFSCSKDEVETIETVQEEQAIKNILSFDSPEEVNNKINLIRTLKNEKETAVVDEMFNSKNSSTFDISKQTELTDDLINYAKEYHRRKLENIYSVREELGFTSIQSIADEINSLKLISPSRATKLFAEYHDYLYQGKFLVKPNTAPGISEVLNLEGKLLLKNNVRDYLQENYAIIGNKGPIAVSARQDILTGNPFYAITWHTGYQYFNNGNPFLPHQYTPFTKLASFINIGGGYFLYPSKSSLRGISQATYIQPIAGGGAGLVAVGFGSSPSTYIAEIDRFGETISLGSRSDASFYVTRVQIGSGLFNTLVGESTISLASNSFTRSF